MSSASLGLAPREGLGRLLLMLGRSGQLSEPRRGLVILKIAYLFNCASYEDVLCMNVDQHDVNWLVVPFSTMNKTSNMMLSLFEKAVLI